MAKATYNKRGHLIVGFLMVSEGESMAIMSGSMVAGHGPSGPSGPVRCQST